jgi:AraC-like DNA-binding protein
MIEDQSYRASTVEETNSLFDWGYCPLVVRPRGRERGYAFTLDVVHLGPLTVGELEYGADVATSLGYLDAYQLNIPLAGQVAAEQHGCETRAGAGMATVFRPTGDVRQPLITGDCRQLATKIDKGALERELTNLLGHPVAGPVRIPLGVDLRAGAGLGLVRLLRLIRAEAGNRDGLLYQPLIADRLWHSVLTAVLLATDHQYREALERTAAPSRPSTVKRAIDVMEAHPELPHTMHGLATHAGVGVRALQEGFRRHVGVSPMAYLRRVRLVRVHDDLRACEPRTATVAAVARRWGFAHLGRFAREYRFRFGVSASETLATPPGRSGG